MIRTFADRHTQELYLNGRSKRMPPDLWRRASGRLEYIEHATCLDDLRVPPSNRLHRLRGDRGGQYSISIDDQWRIGFRFKDGDAHDLEISDYR